MTDTQGGEAAEVVTTNAPAERDFEAEAADQGWRPQTEWTGKPEHWKDARTWVENGDTKARISKVEKDYAERFERLEKATRSATAAVVATYEKQITDLKAEKKAAIKAGDEAAVEAIDEKIDELKDKKADAPEKVAKTYDDFDDNYAPESQDSPDHEVLVSAFIKKNPWMIDEPDMANYAREVSRANAEANPKIGFKANMSYVVERVQKKFADYFVEIKETAANGHAAVDGGGNTPGAARKTAKGFSDLPAEAKQAYERFDPRVKAALSKEKYAREYYDA